ncbi:MAG: hypothetical protein H7330_03715 [Hymenobacteraceae bacterium]|nr:hypothetical protein [Hymenobacteraceae bacterium]
MPLLSRLPALITAGFLLLAAPVSAQPGAARAIIAAEFAFAADALAHGTKPAFLAVMDDSAIFFPAAIPLLARPYWLAKPDPAPTDPVLRWAPALAGASHDGDLGYTTGPWRINGPDGKAVATGHFFTIWGRQPDGSYKWLLDNGISSPLATAPAALPTLLQVISSTERIVMGTGAQPLAVGWLDEQLSADIAKRGMVAAYTVRLHEQARLLREESVPLTTSIAIQRSLGTEPAWRLTPAGGRVAASRELAYSYGRYEAPGGAGGSYVHLWRRGRAGWQLLLEITNSAPAPAAK